MPDDITQLVFTYSLLNGCMACELAGIAKVALNFSKDGTYLGAQLLELDPPPVASSSSKVLFVLLFKNSSLKNITTTNENGSG